MSLVFNEALIGAAGQGGAYQIEQSLRWANSSGMYLSQSINSAPTSSTLATISFWYKATQQDNGYLFFDCRNGSVDWGFSGGIKYSSGFGWGDATFGSAANATGVTNYWTLNQNSSQPALRDPSAWYHVVLQWDSGNGTSTKRQRIWVNGVESDFYNYYGSIGSNEACYWTRNGYTLKIGGSSNSDYLMAEVHCIDGQRLDPDNFAEEDTNGVYVPIEYTGSYGNNGFYLKFDSGAANGIGHDHSGQGNHFSATGFDTSGTGTDVMSDTPTTNWCTFNPVYASQNNSGNQFSEGNLRYVSSGLAWRTNVPTFGSISSGKWYWEWSVNTADAYCGIIGEDVNTVTSSNTQSEAGTILYYSGNGNKRIDNVASSYGSAYNGGGSGWNPVVGIALDKDNNTITFYRNGVSQGTINLSSSSVDLVNKPVRPAFIIYDGTSYGNFGQFAFQHTPPTGFKALNTKNLPAPTIKDGSKYFDTALYAGSLATAATVGATQTVTGLNTSLTPDMVWIKNRGSGRHVIFDVERLDADGDNALRVDSQDQESANVRGGVSALNAGGFTAIAGSDSSDSTGVTCQTGNNYVAWAWAEGATQGMDVLTGTGGTAVNHNLGVAPDFVIFKYTNATSDWNVYHKDITSTSQRMILNSTAAVGSISASWTINATNFAYGGGSNNWVAYLFSEVEGFSKFGKYTGNGNADGPFVYCGFRPRWIMLKKTNTSTIYTSWSIYDTARDSYNVSDAPLYANVSDQEGTNSQGTVESGHNVDILSNGFKLRDSNQIRNTSGDTYIFAAFAENPFGGSGVSPATAR